MQGEELISCQYVVLLWSPHPPLIIPEVGRGQEKGISATTAAYEKAAQHVAKLCPDTVVVTTPHTVMYADYFHISPGRGASGDFRQFRAKEIRMDAEYDSELRSYLCRLLDRDRVYGRNHGGSATAGWTMGYDSPVLF